MGQEPEVLKKLLEDLDKAKAVEEMPQLTYPEQILKEKTLRELFKTYFGKEHVHNLYTQEEKMKLEFYNEMIRKEDFS